MIRPPPSSPLFPNTPLSRSLRDRRCQLSPSPPSIRVLSQRPAPIGTTVRVTPGLGPRPPVALGTGGRSEEHTSELQSRLHLVCRLLLEKKKATMTRVSPSN